MITAIDFKVRKNESIKKPLIGNFVTDYDKAPSQVHAYPVVLKISKNLKDSKIENSKLIKNIKVMVTGNNKTYSYDFIKRETLILPSNTKFFITGELEKPVNEESVETVFLNFEFPEHVPYSDDKQKEEPFKITINGDVTTIDAKEFERVFNEVMDSFFK